MKATFTRITLLLILGLVWQGCEEDPDLAPSDDSDEYYPIFMGMQNTWRTDSVVYDESEGEIIYSSALIRETVVDSFEDAEGNTMYTVERHWGDTLGENYQFKDFIAVGYDGDLAIRNEDNLRYVKLEFPLYQGRQWEGNRFINTEIIIFVAGESLELFKFWPDYYTVTAIEEDATVGEITYEEVITILQADEDSKIERRYSLEKYARNIGLVYREQWILDTQCKAWAMNLEDCMPISWEVKAEKGYIIRQTRVE